MHWQVIINCVGCGSSCSVFTSSNATFTDGSESSDYPSDSDCSWIIAPDGSKQILLNITVLSTQQDKDFVTVYECSYGMECQTQYWKQLAVLSGNTLPSSLILSKLGYMKVTFSSDSSIGAAGFAATYSSVCVPSLIPMFVYSKEQFLYYSNCLQIYEYRFI